MIFDFATEELRNEVINRIKQAKENSLRTENNSTPSVPPLTRSSSKVSRTFTDSPGPLTPKSESDNNSGSNVVPSSATSLSFTSTDVLSPLARTIESAQLRCVPNERTTEMPKVINIPSNVVPSIKPRHFVCLTIGSRGDVQPYIALCKGLQRKGQTVTIVTHAEYKEWVEGWGVEHRTAGGDPGALMKLSVEHKVWLHPE